MKKLFYVMVLIATAFLLWLPFVFLAGAGCTSANVDRVIQTYEQIEAQKQAEKDAKAKAEADRIEEERKANADAKAEEDRKEAALQAKHDAIEAKAGPHPNYYREDAKQALIDYWNAGTLPRVVAPDNPAWGATLWKAVNHSGNGIVFLLDAQWIPHYEAGAIKAVNVCADPWGRKVLRKGKVSKPYDDGRPCIRIDGILGYQLRPGPVYVVMTMGNDAVGAVWYISDPGKRIEKGTK